MLTELGNNIALKRDSAKDGAKSAEIIAVTSGKGGVGKSSISTNMALLFQQMRKKVLLIDADIHLGNIDLMLGLRTEHTLADVLNDGVQLSDIIVQGPGCLDVLPASSASSKLLEMEDVFLKKMAQEFSQVDNRYDYIIVDTGAGVADSVLSFLLGADKIVLVVTSDPASIADAYAVIKIIKSIDVDIPILIAPNMMSSHEAGEELFKKVNLMVRRFLKTEVEYAGTMLRHELLARSVKIQKPVVIHNPNAAASNNLRMFSRRVMQMPARKTKSSKNVFDRFVVNKKKQYKWD